MSEVRLSPQIVKSLLKGNSKSEDTPSKGNTLNPRENLPSRPDKTKSEKLLRRLTFEETMAEMLQKEDLPETREIGTIIVALYAVFVEGGLEKLFQAHANRNRKELTEEEKADLVVTWLDFLIQKLQKDEEKSQKTTTKLTVGYELEFVDAQIQEISKMVLLVRDFMENVPGFGTLCSTYFLEGIAWSPEVIENLLETVDVKKRKKLKQALQVVSHLSLEVPNKSKLLYDFNDWRDQEAQYLSWGGSITGLPDQAAESIFFTNGVQEIRSTPSYSMRTQLREITWLVKSGLSEHGEVNLHTTYAGVELTIENPEFMEATLLSAAAGFLPSRIFQEIHARTSVETEDFSGFMLQERSPKSSLEMNGYVWFPYHKTRSLNEINYVSFQDTWLRHKQAVERRGLFSYAPDELQLLYKDTLLAEAAAHCIAALQIATEDRDEKDKKLAQLWLDLMSFWKGSSFFDTSLRRLPSIAGGEVPQSYENNIDGDWLVSKALEVENVLGMFQLSALRDPSQYYEVDYSKIWKSPYNFLLQDLYLNSFDSEFEAFTRVVRKRVQVFIMDVREVLTQV